MTSGNNLRCAGEMRKRNSKAQQLVSTIGAFRPGDALTTVPETRSPRERGDTAGGRRLSRTRRRYCAGRTEAQFPYGLRLLVERHADAAS